jgi:lipooligosaccharide transport system ATP-binding protein
MNAATQPEQGAIARDAVLSVREMRKLYGRSVVVDGLSFEIRRGECYGLLGPNGAGKTTTLRCCLGLTDPDGGEITLLDQPVPLRAREARVRVGVVPQMDNLDPDFTVTENLLIYGRYFGLRDETIRWRGRSSMIPISFSWTSRPPGSIPRHAT